MLSLAIWGQANKVNSYITHTYKIHITPGSCFNLPNHQIETRQIYIPFTLVSRSQTFLHLHSTFISELYEAKHSSIIQIHCPYYESKLTLFKPYNDRM